jgi:predicted metal-dependent hydrolase
MLFFSRKTAPLVTDHFEVATDEGLVAVALRRHARARNYTLRLQAATGTPVLTMPMRGSLREARAFLDRHAGWLARQIRKRPQARPIAHGKTIPLRGVPHVIRHAAGKRGTVTIGTDEESPSLSVAGDRAHLRRRLIDFLKREARRDLEPAVMRYAALLAVNARAIKLRDPASRWGSCSTSGHLSFSWRLVMAPPHVLDYLAAHEVAHLKEMNHSRRFWSLVESICPETRAARAWLSTHGAALHAIGADDVGTPSAAAEDLLEEAEAGRPSRLREG